MNNIFIGDTSYEIGFLEYEEKFFPKAELSPIERFFRNRSFMKRHPDGLKIILPDDVDAMNDHASAVVFLDRHKDQNSYLYRTASVDVFDEYFRKEARTKQKSSKNT